MYGLFFRAWWLSFGIIFSPVAFWASSKFSKQLLLGYLVYLLADIVIQSVFTFLNDAPLLIALTLLLVAVQFYVIYYVYKFRARIPKNVELVRNEIQMETLGSNSLEEDAATNI